MFDEFSFGIREKKMWSASPLLKENKNGFVNE